MSINFEISRATSATTSHSTMMQPSGQPVTAPEYLQRQKEIKSRYSLKNLKKRLSSNDVNAIFASSHCPKFCFSQSNILSTVTPFAYCGSSSICKSHRLSRCCTSSLSSPRNFATPGSLIECYDHDSKKIIYTLVKKQNFFIVLNMIPFK